MDSAAPAVHRGGVLVTGASSGIGAACVRRLCAGGFRVFATARRAGDFAELEREGAVPVMMDVTDAASVADGCARMLAELGDRPLAGVVNNAGIAAIGPWEHFAIAELRRVLEVNVVGAVCVTQALLPRLRRDRGRVVLLSSVAGRVAVPFLGAYACSKFALEAFADSLRRELRRSGVRVVLVEPSAVRTPIWGRLDPGPPTAEVYRSDYARFREHTGNAKKAGIAPERVAALVERALVDRRPATRVLATRHNPWFYRLYASMPDRVVDFVIALRAKKSSRKEQT